MRTSLPLSPNNWSLPGPPLMPSLPALPWITSSLRAVSDTRQKLRSYAASYADRAARAVPFELLARHAAANDPAAAEVWAQMRQERLVGMTHFASHLGEGDYL